MFSKKLSPLNSEELEPLSPSHKRHKNSKKPTHLSSSTSFFKEPDKSYTTIQGEDVKKEKEGVIADIPIATVIPTSQNWETIEWFRRPNAGVSPTMFTVVLCFKKWDVESTGGKEILTWNGVIELYWDDFRLNGYPVDRGVPEDIWRPKTIGNTGFDLGVAEKGLQVPKFAKTSQQDSTHNNGKKEGVSDGSLKMHVPVKLGGGGFNMSELLKRFRSFPYDSVRIDLICQFHNPHKNGDSPPYLKLNFDRPNLKNRLNDGIYQHVDWTATRHANDYALKQFSYAIGTNPTPLWGNPAASLPGLLLSLQIARTPNFYVSKGMTPLYLVSFFGLLTYSIEPADLPSRISLVSALFFTVYAIQWVTIERLPRLPFSTVLDGVAQSVVSALILIAVGTCVSFKMGRPKGGCSGECGDDFDTEKAEVYDRIFAVVVMLYVGGYSFLYHVIYKSKQNENEHGWTRPWVAGRAMSNKWFGPIEAYRLVTDEEFEDRTNKKFMGEGNRVEKNDEW
ncbi:hypothetical protein TrST_g10010 [Triparma strigata]|uniref:Uncharacterized protein n=1 Tax=Triparma strigata TaxID=1606541 RepID=A0A9W7EUZ6_9STRA|nr:hypothetical protein TrST_g10010 [Triparma strigata]